MKVGNNYRNQGFTIVELLIVIVVIGILAALVLNTISGVQKRARAASMADGISKVDKAFKTWMIAEGYTTWPRETMFSTANPTLEQMRSESSFSDHLQEAPVISGVDSEPWAYDNDNDIKPPNCGDKYNGVNLVIKPVNDRDMALMVDEQLDDGDFDCGKIRVTGDNRLFYSLSYDQEQ